MTHPIPNAALDDRLGFIGTSGSGKTYNAGGAVERLLKNAARVVIIDPLGVWWGLRLDVDGRRPSPFNVAIFGGPHGDLPLNEHAGALIGETAATMAESCIIDLSELGSKSSDRRFMTAFLETIYRKAGGDPFHLIVDEADLFAPQKPSSGDETLLGHMENIVRRGRVKGFIPWLISQRPAVLNKNVLSQADGLIAFKLTSSQDRDALDAWIEGQADKAQGKAIKDELPAMQVGQGVVWLPRHGILRTAQFPPKITFDSSRAPKRGEKQKRTAALKPLDLGALKERLSTVEAETKANDPKALRVEIAALKKQIAQTPKAVADPDAIKRAEAQGFDRGERETAPIWFRRGVEAATGAIKGAVDQFNRIDFIQRELKTWSAIGTFPRAPAPQPPPSVAPQAPPRAKVTNGSGAKLPRAERRILTALAQYPQGRTKNQIAVLAAYAVGGGGFNNALSALRSAGYLNASGDRLEITDDGLTTLGNYDPLPTGTALLNHWLGQLGKAEREALRILANHYPTSLTKETLAEAAGYAPDGGGFNNALSRLRTLELISGRGELKASDDLFG